MNQDQAKHVDPLEEGSYNFDVKAEIAAAEKGLVVVRPEPNQLQLDLDSEEAYVEWARRFNEMGFGDLGFDVEVECHFSNSGPPHRHITLTFTRLGYDDNNQEIEEPYIFGQWERMALQAALGSDPIREFLNVKRLVWGTPDPSRLFERPPQ